MHSGRKKTKKIAPMSGHDNYNKKKGISNRTPNVYQKMQQTLIVYLRVCVCVDSKTGIVNITMMREWTSNE